MLEEAVPSPTDVVDGLVGGPDAIVPGIIKDRFNVNVVIESNDMLFHLRSDSLTKLTSVSLWLQGSNNLNGRHVPSPDFGGLLRFQTPRVQFVQQGLPRKVADEHGFEFASRINPDSTMAMGFVDQQTNAAGPAAITTFVGNASAKLTSAQPGDYFDNGAIAHFSHVIEDLFQFYALPHQDPRHPDGEPFTERCQYMFRSNQLGTPSGIPSVGHAEQFRNGGGPAFINNVFQGTEAALLQAEDAHGKFTPGNARLGATFTGESRVGHEEALQQVSRAADSTPLHIRADGPGFDGMDVPAFRTFPTAVRGRGAGRQQPVQAAVPHLRADRGPVRPDAQRAGRAAVPEAVHGRRDRRQRPGAAHHRDPAAELPGPAPAAPGLPAAGTGRRRTPASTPSTPAGPGQPRPAPVRSQRVQRFRRVQRIRFRRVRWVRWVRRQRPRRLRQRPRRSRRRPWRLGRRPRRPVGWRGPAGRSSGRPGSG